jgi:hypothetical protein
LSITPVDNSVFLYLFHPVLAGNRLITSDLDLQLKTQALIELLDELIVYSATPVSSGLCLCLVEFDNILHVIPATQVYT